MSKAIRWSLFTVAGMSAITAINHYGQDSQSVVVPGLLIVLFAFFGAWGVDEDDK